MQGSLRENYIVCPRFKKIMQQQPANFQELCKLIQYKNKAIIIIEKRNDRDCIKEVQKGKRVERLENSTEVSPLGFTKSWQEYLRFEEASRRAEAGSHSNAPVSQRTLHYADDEGNKVWAWGTVATGV